MFYIFFHITPIIRISIYLNSLYHSRFTIKSTTITTATIIERQFLTTLTSTYDCLKYSYVSTIFIYSILQSYVLQQHCSERSQFTSVHNPSYTS